MIILKDHNDLLEYVKNTKKIYILLYKSENSEQSKCAYTNISNIENSKSTYKLAEVDVLKVKDIHGKYNITTVPTVLEFTDGNLKNIIKGCHKSDYYQNIFESKTSSPQTNSNNKPQKNVTVYSTPTCSWCTTLKNYLRDNGINFRDIDVSKDSKAAEEMVKRSGQQGVPQTTINGELIIGFDKMKIDKLLNIK
jgi:glutaredoxin-like YruB-family protein